MAKKVAKKVTKKRVRKNVERGQAHIQSSFNNTIVTLTDALEVQRNLLHMLHRWLLKQQQRLLLFTD